MMNLVLVIVRDVAVWSSGNWLWYTLSETIGCLLWIFYLTKGSFETN